MSKKKKIIWTFIVIVISLIVLFYAPHKGKQDLCGYSLVYNFCANITTVIGGAGIFSIPTIIIYNIWKS